MKYLVTEKTAAWIRAQQAARPVQAVVGPTRKDGRMGRDVNDFERPFAICWSEAEKAWLIYFPHGSITSDGNYETLVQNDLTASTEYADGWYVLNVSAGNDWTSVYLDCWATESGSASGSRDYHAQITTSPSSHSGAIETYLVRLADIKSYSETGAKPVRQITVGALVLRSAADPDNASIDVDKDGKTEFYHFKDNQQDSGKGLAKRLKANPETGEITSDDNTGVMLVARKNGKVIYIPLSGDGEDPEDPETPGGEQCDHDETGGKEGGVAPSKEPEPGSGPAGGVPAGGVPASGGDRHTGDDGCNCK